MVWQQHRAERTLGSSTQARRAGAKLDWRMDELICTTIRGNEDHLEHSKTAWRDAAWDQAIAAPQGAVEAMSSTQP